MYLIPVGFKQLRWLPFEKGHEAQGTTKPSIRAFMGGGGQKRVWPGLWRREGGGRERRSLCPAF